MTKEEYWKNYRNWELCWRYNNKFDEWWDADKYDWEKSSAYLAHHCFKHFDKWWDADKFNWSEGSWYLARYLRNYFDIWWDPDRFDWKDSEVLAISHAKNFYKWWDPEKFNWDQAWALAEHCSEHLDIWWDADKYNWAINLPELTRWCSSEFTNYQLKQLLLHPNKIARKFATKELERRENGKRPLVEEI